MQVLNFSDNDINTVSDFLETDEKNILNTKGVGEKSIIKIKDSITKHIESLEA